ncbi:MAG TPA: hypothetical protein VL003_06935 [Pusillimonas sp.]|uniref:hypothetical protein n=1 Tax=Pusillimonas sp. TaxID=3040095 RepID=UPI002B7312CD|nr:hypothetical protein [Pusillimonas sp.]HUH87773.1 hypothetical protein [Pusillimonas sp.]
MNKTLMAATGMVMCIGLIGCTTPRDATQLSQKTVHYACGPQGAQQPLTVQYTFQGTEALAAKVIYNNQAVDLTRATASNADMVGNTFRGNGYTWTTDKFTYDSVGETHGNMLTQDVAQNVNGQRTTVSNIIANNCVVAGPVRTHPTTTTPQ